MIRHVLLMLSSREEPPPEDEVRFHQEWSVAHGRTHLVTTRRLTDLTPGRSRVALYGDTDLGNRLLGWGTYAAIRPLSAPPAQAAVGELPLYAGGRMPKNAALAVELTRVELAPAGTGIEALNGEMEASGAPLRRENLPTSAARALIYYRNARPQASPSAPAG